MVNLAKNLSVDKLRSKDFKNSSKSQNIDNSVAYIDEQQSSALNLDALDVREMVDNLKPDAKAVLNLIYFKGFTHVEAAEELGIPLGTVKTRARLAIIHLRKLFK